MAINPATGGANGLSAQNQQDVSGPKKSLGQEDFLRLMVAQVQHQDPLDPQTNGDFIAQLAQFSTSDGITKMQHSIQDLASTFQSNQALQASSLVGRKVLVNSNSMQLGVEGESKMFADVPAPVSNLNAEIYSENGELIKKIPLGSSDVGQLPFSWDGLNEKGERVAPGKYMVQVTGTYEGKPVALNTLAAANVNSVTLGQNGEGIRLNVSGVGSISLDQVKQVTN